MPTWYLLADSSSSGLALFAFAWKASHSIALKVKYPKQVTYVSGMVEYDALPKVCSSAVNNKCCTALTCCVE